MSTTTQNINVLLTGGNGYIGCTTLAELLRSGFNVTTSVRSLSKTEFLKNKFSAYGDRLSFTIVPDLVEKGAFDNTFKEKAFHFVIHTSSPVTFVSDNVKKDILDPAIEGTKNLLLSVDQHAPTVKRVVILSSFAAIDDSVKGTRPGYTYSESDWNPITMEEALTNPTRAYYGSKKLSEKAAWDFVNDKERSFSLTTIISPMVYGPPEQEVSGFDKLNWSVGTMYSAFTGQGKVATYVWIYIDVRDLAKALVNSITKEYDTNERLLITAGNASAKHLLEFLWRRYPERAVEKNIEKFDGEFYPAEGVYEGDNTKSKRLLGMEYLPLETTLEDSFRRLEELEERIDWLGIKGAST